MTRSRLKYRRYVFKILCLVLLFNLSLILNIPFNIFRSANQYPSSKLPHLTSECIDSSPAEIDHPVGMYRIQTSGRSSASRNQKLREGERAARWRERWGGDGARGRGEGWRMRELNQFPGQKLAAGRFSGLTPVYNSRTAPSGRNPRRTFHPDYPTPPFVSPTPYEAFLYPFHLLPPSTRVQPTTFPDFAGVAVCQVNYRRIIAPYMPSV